VRAPCFISPTIHSMDTNHDNQIGLENRQIGYAEAAQFLGLPRGTLYWLVSEKRVPHIRLGRRLVRFSVQELQNWLAEHAVPAQNGSVK